MSEGMPTQWEQDVSETYVNEHPLNRPKTNIKDAILFSLMFVVLTGFATWLIYFVVYYVGILSSLSQSMYEFTTNHPILTVVIIYAVVFFVAVCVCSNIIVIGVIRIYQHYAPEEIRRRCLFKPTCSEYAILAVQKYGVVIGLYKSINRLINRCKGNIYQIDCP